MPKEEDRERHERFERWFKGSSLSSTGKLSVAFEQTVPGEVGAKVWPHDLHS